MIDLTDRVAFVSGAAGGGIGTATVTALATAGAAVYVNARRPVAAEQVCLTLTRSGLRAEPAVLDVSDSRSLFEFVGRFGQPDIVVHNAAVSQPCTPAWRLDDDAWKANFQTITDGAFNLVKAFTPSMIAKRYGKVLVISSSASYRGTYGRNIGYAAAKAGLNGMCAQLALELAPYGICVNAVAPAQVDTPRIRANGRKTTASLSRLGSTLPIGRVGRPEEIANLIAFLASDLCNYLIGQVISVDGGAALASKLTAESGIA